MGKAILKRAGSAATESIFRDLMPFLDERFKFLDERFVHLHEEIQPVHGEIRGLATKIDEVDRRLDAKIGSLRDEMLDRFENQLQVINQVSHRITKLEGRVEGFMEMWGTMFEPVKVGRKRKAG